MGVGVGGPPAPAGAGYRRELGDGLLLRWSTPEDTEGIAELVGRAFRDGAGEPPNAWLMGHARQQARGEFPWLGVGDFGVVQDTSRPDRPIVACTCLWRNRWLYEDVPLPVGRPEYVATEAEYRNRGLVRALFEMVHARSRAEGHVLQAITGIFYFYRQFGYEYALDLGGERRVPLSRLPRVEETGGGFRLRPATVDDIPLIQRLYREGRRGSMVWTDYPDRLWRYLIESSPADPTQYRRGRVSMIVDGDGHACGLACLSGARWDRSLQVWTLELVEQMSWVRVMPSLLRALAAAGLEMPAERPGVDPLSELTFTLGTAHPAYDVLGRETAAYENPPYAWYVRVEDLPRLLRLLAPVLEARLAASPAAAHFTGELALDFYRDGVRLVFDHGHLSTAEAWRRPLDGSSSANFPPLTFLKLLFGQRTLDELQHMFPDVWVEPSLEPVLAALFPAGRSFVLGV